MIKDILNLFFPGRCFICREIFYAENQNVVCKDCLSSIKKISPVYCKSCGKPIENCQECLKNPKYDYLYVYTKKTDEIIHIISEYKLNGIENLSKELANLIKDDIEKIIVENKIDVITYIPVSNKLKRKRGFNHLEKILKHIFPSYLIKEVLLKTKDTKLQVNLSREERIFNLKGVFSLKEDIQGKNVLIFDDILTTGATMLEAYKTIRKGNPDKIYGYVITR